MTFSRRLIRPEIALFIAAAAILVAWSDRADAQPRGSAVVPPFDGVPLPPGLTPLRPKPMADVVTPASPDPGPVSGSCSATVKTCSANKYCFSGTNSACVQAGFVDGQAWRVCIYATEYGTGRSATGASKGLGVGPVDFRPSAVAPWQRAIYTAGTAELFTGYDNLPPVAGAGGTRLYDTQYAQWSRSASGTTYNWSANKLTPAHLPPNGTLVTLSKDASFGPRVAAECRDRGIAWLCHGLGASLNQISNVRRGEELVLWGVFDSGNYDYVVEYGFRDDGTIAFRTGVTGYNNRKLGLTGTCTSPTNNPSCGDVPHVHDVLWRIDVDVNGGAHDNVAVARHLDTGLSDDQKPFNGGLEGGMDWKADEYTSLVIEDVLHTNARGNHPGYEIHPLRFGNARQSANAAEAIWTKHDFWVTQWHEAENSGWADSWSTPDTYLAAYTADPEPVTDTDVVLWYLASAHHDPIDEDRQADGLFGVTLAHFFGFEMNPHNLFVHNPLGSPTICDK